jgi:hypothetical protein
MVRSYVADFDEGRAADFCEARRSNPAIQPILGKVPVVSPGEITPEMLALDVQPSAREVEAIKALSRDQVACRDRMHVVAKDHWPAQTAARKAPALKLDLVTADLIKRKITFAAANRLYQEAALEAEGSIAEARQAQLDKEREQEALAWRTVGDGIRAIAGNQKPEAAEDKCTWAGDPIDCNGR